jgi:hypothetical protein
MPWSSEAESSHVVTAWTVSAIYRVLRAFGFVNTTGLL